MTTEFFPEQTIRYKTYAKQTMVTALQMVFADHPDQLLQGTKVSIEFPKTQVEYPSIVVKMDEKEIFNAGVGHFETAYVNGESDSIEVEVHLQDGGRIQLTWPPILNAVGYKLYRGTASNHENVSFQTTSNSFTDISLAGPADAVPNEPSAGLDPPQPVAVVLPPQTPNDLPPGNYFYRVTALFPSEAVRFQHYFYRADIGFDIYALSAFDRDLISDSLIQTITMGTLNTYTDSFFQRIYPTYPGNTAIYPDSQYHFITINSDVITATGELQSATPWAAEDDLIYQSGYRANIFGELYSLPPQLTYGFVMGVIQYPYIAGIDPTYDGAPSDLIGKWVSNSTDGF